MMAVSSRRRCVSAATLGAHGAWLGKSAMRAHAREQGPEREMAHSIRHCPGSHMISVIKIRCKAKSARRGSGLASSTVGFG